MPRNAAILLRLAGVASLAAAGLTLAACDANDGPAEETGRAIDNAADDTADAVEDAADEVEDAADDLPQP
jgi:hypothetical protein